MAGSVGSERDARSIQACRSIIGSVGLATLLAFASTVPLAAADPPAAISGFTTTEVEPNVWRVDADGVGELARPYDQTPPRAGVVAGLDGSVWLTRPRQLVELGGERVALAAEQRPRPDDFADAAVAQDGTIWWTARGLQAYDGESWTLVRQEPGKGHVGAVYVDPDGAVWASWSQSGKTRLGRLEGEEWALIGGKLPGSGDAIGLGDGVTILSTGVGGEVRVHDGERWRVAQRPEGEVQAVAFGSDGTYWARLGRDDGPVLGHWDGDSWTVYGSAHDIPAGGTAFGGYGAHAVAPDGSLWFAARKADAGPLEDCDGVVRFDGVMLSHYLSGSCVHDLDIDPQGGVWLIASVSGTPSGGELLDVGPIELFHIPGGVPGSGA